ncbi:MAG: GNAT family N-acetyltransferase [Pseudomonadota bacterium]
MPVKVTTYLPQYAEDFRVLNEQWINEYFTMEDADRRALGDPENYILAKGGEIVFAVDSPDQVLGTCAVVRHSAIQCELAKMAVSPEARGQGIGEIVGSAAIEIARNAGYEEMYLETNSVLGPALGLYHKLGFEQRPFPFDSDYQRANVYMVLDL